MKKEDIDPTQVQIGQLFDKGEEEYVNLTQAVLLTAKRLQELTCVIEKGLAQIDYQLSCKK